MSAQMVNTFQMWCNCVKCCVEHKRIGLQDFGWAVMDVYRCTMCGAWKCFPVGAKETCIMDRATLSASVNFARRRPHRS